MAGIIDARFCGNDGSGAAGAAGSRVHGGPGARNGHLDHLGCACRCAAALHVGGQHPATEQLGVRAQTTRTLPTHTLGLTRRAADEASGWSARWADVAAHSRAISARSSQVRSGTAMQHASCSNRRATAQHRLAQHVATAQVVATSHATSCSNRRATAQHRLAQHVATAQVLATSHATSSSTCVQQQATRTAREVVSQLLVHGVAFNCARHAGSSRFMDAEAQSCAAPAAMRGTPSASPRARSSPSPLPPLPASKSCVKRSSGRGRASARA
jgi:hypothetical protein